MSNDTDRIADFERRLSLVEREHKRLLEAQDKETESRKEFRAEVDKTIALDKDYWDDRIRGLAGKIAASGNGEPSTELAHEIGTVLAELFAERDGRLRLWVLGHVQRVMEMLDAMTRTATGAAHQ